MGRLFIRSEGEEMAVKKLIEVALPLDKINAESAREKSIRHGHPSTLHLWWARRPLAAARAVIWASLVDDPSSHPELFPTEKEQNQERKRLFKILEDLVVWENSNNEAVLSLAKKEIMKSTGNNPPALLDPFAGGGAIPLEAQRLGLRVYAHDLNPVAVTINKAMIEIPSRFADFVPVNTAKNNTLFDTDDMNGIKGVASDVVYYSKWMLEQARERLTNLYPDVYVAGKKVATNKSVVAWIWARTATCSNPACGCEMPLVSSYVISKKKGNETWVEPIVANGEVMFKIHKGKCPKGKETPKMGRNALFKCPACGQVTQDSYIKSQGKENKIGMQLMAIAVNGKHGREYYPASKEQELAIKMDRLNDYHMGQMPNNPRWFSPPAFGMSNYEDIFSNRQIASLTTFCELVEETRNKIEKDALSAGYLDDDVSFRDGGRGAKAYSEAIGVYIAFLVDKLASINSSICQWEPMAQCPRIIFGRQAIPMMWDFAEANPIGTSSGSFEVLIKGYIKLFDSGCFDFIRDYEGVAEQEDAQSGCHLENVMISTDPPYYDNIGYADLSDFFYIWLRRNIGNSFPSIYRTLMTPKGEELIATPYRFNGSMVSAKKFFEDGMLQACTKMYKCTNEAVPLTIYYAYKQSDNKDDASASSGWETMISAIVKAGFAITGTWPMRTEMVSALKANVNALASSIVLVCRKRPHDAPVCTRRNFINELKRELRPALQKLQNSNIAPVDLAQSAIGPGMGVYSKYSQVLEADGKPMSVRSALKVINQELDLYFNEQDGDLDSESRFCVELYSQVAFNEMKFGDANTLATAKNTSVAVMASHGILYAQKGVVHLTPRPELPVKINANENSIWLLCQQLTYKMEKDGIEGCANVIVNMFGSNAERAKDLAYRLYTIAERKKWAQEAYAYNALVVAWPEIQSRAAEMKSLQSKQLGLFDQFGEV